ncbi:MAG: HmuY family protein [Treponema sp.]|jgi:hypothetical protein|nr:HmuY family protein [Treponema sp.]
MKQRHYFFIALVCVVSLFLGCKTEAPGPNYGGEVKELPSVSLAAADGIKYYSLSTGLEVIGDDINSNKWDIAFSRTRLIFTNSGASAEKVNSGGQGGVWYTDKTELSGVAIGDQKGDDYTTDQKRYVTGMGGAAETILNVMSYVGYDNEGTVDGLSAENAFSGYSYNKQQYYHSSGMGVYASDGTEPVYIIRHGDGVHYSKIKIDYQYADSKDNWAVSYQNFF